MIECYCDYEPAAVYHVSRPMAHKAHRCSECGRTIYSGERYERVFGVWDGRPDTFKTCVYCLGLRDLAESRLRCLCWAHGNMVEDVMETIRNAEGEISGLAMAAGRWMIEGRRDR